MIWIIVIGIVSGMISGMGIGGGTILIPALLFLQDMNQQQAQGINLIYFIPTAVIALITHIKNKNIETKIVKSIAFTGLLGAAAGAFLLLEWMQNYCGNFLADFCLLWDYQKYSME